MALAVEDVARRAIRAWCGVAVSRDLDLTIEGLDHLPTSGPVLIASRHYHYMYDGYVYLSRLPRFPHLLVGLDWVRSGTNRRVMEVACRVARWPVVLRGEQPRADRVWAGDAPSARGYVRRALTLGADLLREGEALVVFPEGYPNVDPVYTPKRGDDTFLPFQNGYIKIVELAQRRGAAPVAVVPAGFTYIPGRRWRVTLRFGPPDYLAGHDDAARLGRAVEDRVRTLSATSSSVPA